MRRKKAEQEEMATRIQCMHRMRAARAKADAKRAEAAARARALAEAERVEQDAAAATHLVVDLQAAQADLAAWRGQGTASRARGRATAGSHAEPQTTAAPASDWRACVCVLYSCSLRSSLLNCAAVFRFSSRTSLPDHSR